MHGLSDSMILFTHLIVYEVWKILPPVKQDIHLKALFNNVSPLKNLSCIALHAISVFDKV